MGNLHIFRPQKVGKFRTFTLVHVYGAARSLFLIVARIDQATLYLLCSVSFLWLGRHKEAHGCMLQEMRVLMLLTQKL